MSSVHITAARASQNAMLRETYTGCPKCFSSLTMAEITERHCIECSREIAPQEIKKRIIHKHSNINTGGASDAA